MNRRQWLRASGGIGAGMAFAKLGDMPAWAAAAGTCNWETTIKRLKLRHTWTTTMSSSAYRDTIFVTVENGGVTGVGEGAPIVRYHENAEDGAKAIAAITPTLDAAKLWHFEKLTEIVSKADARDSSRRRRRWM